MADYNSAYTGAEIDQGVGNGLAAPTTYAPIAHDDANTTYGKGTDTKYGHLKLSASTSSTSGTSGGIAATPSAVKAAYDLANGKQDPATTLAGYGITDAATSNELGTFVRPNILDNWYFAGGGSQQGGGQFPINQRGNTSITAQGYCIDRWYKVSSYGTASLVSGGLSVSSDGVNYCTLTQYLEDSLSLCGKTVTISRLLSDGTLLSASGTLPASFPQSDTMLINTTNIQVRGNSNGFRVNITKLESSTTCIAAIKLELGDTQTLAHEVGNTWVLNEVPNFQQELARCQRFAFSIGTTSPPFFVGTTGATSSKPSFFVPTPVSMRANPTVTGMDSVNAQFAGGYKNNVSLSGISCVANTNGIRINATASEAITSNAYENASYSNRSTVLFSADL